jgi:signal peptidase II
MDSSVENDNSKLMWGRGQRVAVALVILVATLVCDQVTKHIARVQLGERGPISLAGGMFEFVLAENSGAFLSLGSVLPPAARTAIFTVGTALGLFALAVYLIRNSKLTPVMLVGLSLVCAGGIGNLIDRMTRGGHVTDFMFLQVGPLHTGVFNVADMAIMAGVGMLLFYTFKSESKKGEKKEQVSESSKESGRA